MVRLLITERSVCGFMMVTGVLINSDGKILYQTNRWSEYGAVRAVIDYMFKQKIYKDYKILRTGV